MIMDMEVSGSAISPSITHGDLAPDRMSSTKLSMVSRMTVISVYADMHTHNYAVIVHLTY